MEGLAAHGTRQYYQHARCRCTPCRAANARYAAFRARPQPGWTSPTEAQAYLCSLEPYGVGYRQAAKLSGISISTIKAIKAGARTRILQRHHEAIVRIPPYPAMGQRISSKRAKHLLHSLHTEGFTDADVAAKLGLHERQLTLHTTITVKRSLQVQALWRKLTTDELQQSGVR